MIFATGRIAILLVLSLASGNIVLLVWANRNPQMGAHWPTTLLAASPIILLSGVCIYLLRVAGPNPLAGIALMFYMLVHFVLLAGSIGIAEAYFDQTQSSRA